MRVEVVSWGWKSVGSGCSLLLLGEAQTRWRTPSWSWRHAQTPTAAAALLALHPPFGQQLLLGVAVRQSADAGVGLSFRSTFFGLDAASWHAVTLHQPRVCLVLGGDTGLGAGTQLVCHGTLRLGSSLWVVVLTFVSVSALLSWRGDRRC